MASFADYVDVVAMKFNAGCSLPQFLDSVMDARIAGQADANSVAGKLGARFRACTAAERRSGYMSY